MSKKYTGDALLKHLGLPKGFGKISKEQEHKLLPSHREPAYISHARQFMQSKGAKSKALRSKSN